MSRVRLNGAEHVRRTSGSVEPGEADEMEIHLVPTLLGSGDRLFENVGDDLHGQLVRTVATPRVTHLKYARRGSR